MGLTSGIEAVDELQGSLHPGLIVLEKGEVSALDLPHILSVRGQLRAGEGGLSSRALWLDGGNAFNPYRISSVARNLGLNPEEALKNVYISRAFTCYRCHP